MSYLSTFELLFFIIISLILIFIMLGLSNVFAPKNVNNEKTGGYECGFEPFSDARNSFEIHFYIVGILFIIFDVEIIFLVPWVLNLSNIGLTAYISMFIFLYFFFIGFIYEFKSGLINWVTVEK